MSTPESDSGPVCKWCDNGWIGSAECSSCEGPEPGSGPVSTVRDALNPWESFIASDGIRSIRARSADDIAERLGINPDMTLAELRERLA